MFIAVRTMVSRGYILLVSLLVLLFLAMLAATVMQTNLLQLRMTNNVERRMQARQAALSQLEAWLSYLGNSMPRGSAGDRHCVEGMAHAACDYADLPLEVAENGATELTITAGDGGLPPPRLAEYEATSAVAYKAYHYEITVSTGVDATAYSATQGVTVLQPGVMP